MKMLKTIVLVLLGGTLLQAAGTVGPVVISNNAGSSAYVSYTIPWVSDASGNANATTFRPLNWGKLVQVEFTPGAGGVQPTTLYDVVLVDTRGIDYLAGGGANLSNTVSTIAAITTQPIVGGGTLELQVTNAGNAKSGTVVVWESQ